MNNNFYNGKYTLICKDPTGIDIPFNGESVFRSTFETKNAIKVNLINYILTNKGERYLNPSFGSDLRSLLFENINNDTLDELEEVITSEINAFFPRVEITDIELTGTPDEHSVRFYLKYRVSETNIQDEILINIEQ